MARDKSSRRVHLPEHWDRSQDLPFGPAEVAGWLPMSEEPVPEEPTDAASEVVIQALSREDGLNSTVTVYRDRIEWVKQEFISSLPRAKDDPPLIPLATIQSVKTRKDGPLFSKVILRTDHQTITFRMISADAMNVRDAIGALLPARNTPTP